MIIKLLKTIICLFVLIKQEITSKSIKTKSELAKFSDGSEYIGETNKDGKRNGVGLMSYSNGDTYIGHWYKDYMTGLGQYNYSNGDRYVGKFSKNKRNGKGKLYMANGKHLFI